MGFLRRRDRSDADEAAAGVTVVDCVPIADVVARRRCRVCGEVVRMSARPTSGQPAMVVLLDDGTGRANALWTGRRAIGGVKLGRWLVIEGTPAVENERFEFRNPSYTLLAGPPERTG